MVLTKEEKRKILKFLDDLGPGVKSLFKRRKTNPEEFIRKTNKVRSNVMFVSYINKYKDKFIK